MKTFNIYKDQIVYQTLVWLLQKKTQQRLDPKDYLIYQIINHIVNRINLNLFVGLLSMGNFILGSILKNYDFYQAHSVWEQWDIVSENASLRLSRVIKHKKNSSILGQLHQPVRVDNTEKHLKILQFRKTHRQSSIVGIFGVYLPNIQQKTNFTLCGQLQNYYLVTEYVPYCFSDIGMIELANGIHIIKHVLSGAKLIKEKIGITTLYDENMIFFDNHNKCKTWINEGTSLNHCCQDSSSISQQESVMSIFSTVQMKIIHSLGFQNYLRAKESCQLNTFVEAINFVNNFQSDALMLTCYGKQSPNKKSNQHRLRNVSEVKTQKIKKSLSAKKTKTQNTKNQKLLSIKNLIKEETSNFIPLGYLKTNELKKQNLKKTSVKEKFSDPLFNNFSNHQKTWSSTSTNQESFQNEKSSNQSVVSPNHLNQKEFQFSRRSNILEPRQINIPADNQKGFRNIFKNNQKLSLSQYHTRLKKNVSLPVLKESINFGIV